MHFDVVCSLLHMAFVRVFAGGPLSWVAISSAGAVVMLRSSTPHSKYWETILIADGSWCVLHLRH